MDRNTLCGKKLDIIIKSGAPALGKYIWNHRILFQTIVVLCGQKIHHVGRKYIMWIEIGNVERKYIVWKEIGIIIKSGAPVPVNKFGTIEYCFKQTQTIVMLCG